MTTPLTNLLFFLAGAALVVMLFWPGRGLVARARRTRRLASRILLEDALKHLYHHESRSQTCTLSSIGGALEIPPARTVSLVNRMQNAGLVTPSGGRILLTEEGSRYALEVVRAHRLWERYLADETGVDPLEWHARAERREHSLSREETEALSQRLGHPRFDPHGDPIPTADGSVPPAEVMALSALASGERAVITHLEDEPAVVYAQLVALGIYPGMLLRMDARTDQRLLFEADGRKVVLAPLLAENVSIQRLTDDEREEAADEDAMTLADLAPGEAGDVVRVSRACRGLERRRLMDLGVVPDTRVEFEFRAPTGGLCAYRVRGTTIALREEQARMIVVRRAEDAGARRSGGA
jgi:DtxR family Mn-dependent transcriptional regulator